MMNQVHQQHKYKGLVQLVTNVPDIIICKSSPLTPIPDTLDSFGVVMFADISGFTALCEKYSNSSASKKKGTDQLTTTLNSYLSKIVQSILISKGDVLKFAGDAFLSYWPCSKFESSQTINNIIRDSLLMQSNYDNYETPDGVTLRMKISLSIGECYIHYIGNATYKTFDITGPVIDDVNLAMNHTEPGQVVVSNAAFELCEKDKYVGESIGENFFQISRNKNDQIGLSSLSLQLMELRNRERTDYKLSFRKEVQSVLSGFSEEAQKYVRTFILKTVLQKIDYGYDISWLSELRQVSVLFINLNPDPSIYDNPEARGENEQKLLQSAFECIYPLLVKYDGTLNKVFMFDKGCTFLCIFGLPHATHEDDPRRAIVAAQEIFISFQSLQMMSYSIGVTTGVAFCGVVGHHDRHEYTVIGQKVNMAARLMTNFVNTLTCDDSTRSKSGLPSLIFLQTAPVTLKGITDPENVYYINSNCEDEFYLPEIHNSSEAESVIGREKEMKIFYTMLCDFTENLTKEDSGVIVLSGPAGIGKTKLLKAMKVTASELGFKNVSVIGGLIEQNTPFFTVKTILTRLLELDKCQYVHDKEQVIVQHVMNLETMNYLSLLNELLGLKFPTTSLVSSMNHSERVKNFHHLLFTIVHQETLNHPYVFSFDEAHWIDDDSWSFILDLAISSKSLFIISTRPIEEYNDSKRILQLKSNPNTKWLELDGLSGDEMISLACHLLNVDKIDHRLSEIICKNSHGIPLWCIELLEIMQKTSVFEITEYSDEETKSVRVCSINGSIAIENIPLPDSVSGMVLARIDNMNPLEQMLIKCASIIGNVFDRDTLRAILPNETTQGMFESSLSSLIESGIIQCSVAASLRNHDNQTDDSDSLQCSCLSTNNTDSCQMLQFRHNYIHETAASLWTEAQFKSLHETAGVYFETYARRCSNCGGGNYILKPSNDGDISDIICSPISRHPVKLLEPIIEAEEDEDGAAYRRGGARRLSTIIAETNESFTDEWLRQVQQNKRGSFLASIPGMNEDVKLNFKNCQCDDILVSVYPQLVYHWKAAGNLDKTIFYLTETAVGAIVINNNMRALSLLEEVQHLLETHKIILTNLEKAKLERLIGQAYFQNGEISECIPHFKQALSLLGKRLPSSCIIVAVSVLKEAFKQYLHIKLPQRWLARKHGIESDVFLEMSHCMANIASAFRLKDKTTKLMMAALSQLNTAEEAEENIYELMESYCTMVDCCMLFNKKRLAERYLNKALKLSSIVQFQVDDIPSYVSLLSTAINYKLCSGNLEDAHGIGNVLGQLACEINNVPLKLEIFPIIFYVNLLQLNIEDCQNIVSKLQEINDTAGDVRAVTILEYCQFDGILDIVMKVNGINKILTSAESCCMENILRYRNIERLLSLSCLSLWSVIMKEFQ
jgi:adenylate cyclase 10